MSDAGGTVVLQLTIPWWGWCGIVAALIGIGIWVGRVNSDRESFKGFVKEIRTDISEIRTNINRIFERLPVPQLVKTSSPVTLTERGAEVSKTVQSKAWSDKHAPHLVDGAHGKEEFEIFDLCVDYVRQQFQEDADLQRAVRAGAYEYGANEREVLKVYEVELRDAVLGLVGVGP